MTTLMTRPRLPAPSACSARRSDPAFVSSIAANLPRKAVFLSLSADVVAIWARRRIASCRPFKASFGRAGIWNLCGFACGAHALAA
jgi:hypothetical protein